MSIFNNKRPLQQAIHRYNTEATHRLLLHPDSGIAIKGSSSSRPTGIYGDVYNLWESLENWGAGVFNALTGGMLSTFTSNLNANDVLVDVKVRTPQGKFTYNNLPLQVDPTSDQVNSTLQYLHSKLDQGYSIYVKLLYDGGKPTAAIATGVVVGEKTIGQSMQPIIYDNAAGNLDTLNNGGWQGFGPTNPSDLQTLLGNYSNSTSALNLSREFKNGHHIDNAYVSIIQAASQRFGIGAELVLAVMMSESSCINGRTSPTGAQGLMQIEPGTFQQYYNQIGGYGFTAPNNPMDMRANIITGALYLSYIYQQFGGDLIKTIASYNAGPGAVTKYGGVPPYTETQNYVKTVIGHIKEITGDISRNSTAPISSRPEFTHSDKTMSGANNGRIVIGGEI